MCRRIECPQCKKPTYAGCGMHVEQVLADVPKDERCACNEKASSDTARSASVLRRFFGL